MAHRASPKSISIKNTTMAPKGQNNSTLIDMLQSDSVRRLFDRPNIEVKAVSASEITSRSPPSDKLDLHLSKPTINPDISILPIQILPKQGSSNETNLLPNKSDGKSSVSLTLLDQKTKRCGHVEPCESVVCDVTFDKYEDYDGSVTPLISECISDDEDITAPVAKHCTNHNCDALSIDHNRCRRAIVSLNRVDVRNSKCDICGRTLKTRKARVNHKVCRRKDEYRHNDKDPTQILKERMRAREMQMQEDDRVKKLMEDLTDPMAAYNRAMETLKNNDEMIVIPKQGQMPIITSVKSLRDEFDDNAELLERTSQIPLLSTNTRVVLPPSIVMKQPADTSTDLNSPSQDPLRLDSQQFSINISDWLSLSQPQIITTTTNSIRLQPKPMFTPIRVVPIANLKTQPSLLHQTQGLPKFCIVADNPMAQAHQISTSNPPVQIQPNIQIQAMENKLPLPRLTPKPSSPKVPIKRVKPIKFMLERPSKSFRCTFCPKRFSTDWYFKVHLARHVGEALFMCKACNGKFSNRYDLRKHIVNEHKNESVEALEIDLSKVTESGKTTTTNGEAKIRRNGETKENGMRSRSSSADSTKLHIVEETDDSPDKHSTIVLD